jgi:hypothetical protein
MAKMKNIIKVSLMAVIMVLTGVSCSTVEVYQYQYDSTLDEVFIKQGADFSRYKTIMIDPVSVWYPDEFAPPPEKREILNANLAKAQNLFCESISKAISDRYTVTSKPSKNVLRLHVEFVDLRAAKQATELPSALARYEFHTRPGHITMIGQMFDASSDEQLARVADLGKQQSVGGDGQVDWDAIASDFDYWANVFSTWLDKIHGQN